MGAGGLLERDSALGVLGSEARSVLVEGPAGIGKSALLRYAAAHRRAAGESVLVATGTPLERDLGWAVAHQLAPEGGTDPVALTAGLLTAGPLLVVVDDLQWVDAPSSRWLAHLQRRLDGGQVRLVLGLRTGEPVTDLEALESLRQGAAVVAPAPLTETALSAMASDFLGGGHVREMAAACLQATGGNPFLVVELLRELQAQGLNGDAATARLVESLDVGTVRRTVVLRLARLDAVTVEVARAVAVLEPHATTALAAQLAGTGPMDAARSVDRLQHAAVLAPGTVPRFTHPLVRAAVLADLGAPVVGELQRRAASLLDEVGEADSAAMHALAAAPAGDAQIVTILRCTAERARRSGSAETEVRCLERALREPPPAADRHALLLELGTAAAGVDATLSAASLRSAVSAAEDEAQRAAALSAVLAAATLTGDLEAARAAADELRARGQMTTAAVAERVRLERTWTEDRASYAEAVSELALRPEPWAALLVRANAAYLRVLRGVDATAAAEEALAVLASTAPAEALAADPGLLNSMAWVLHFCGRSAEAEQVLRAQLALPQPGGRAAILASVLARALTAQGRLAEAEQSGRDALDLATAHGQSAVLAVALAAVLEVAADREVPVALPAVSTTGRMSDALDVERARFALRTGDPDLAVRLAFDAGAALEARGDGAAGGDWRSIAAEGLMRSGQGERARTIADDDVAAASQWGEGRWLGRALRVVALAGDDPITGLRGALTVLVAASPVDAARCRADLGGALRRAGRRAGARSELEQAYSEANAVGATRLGSQIRAELLATGARPRRAALTGPSALTPSELRVAKLAATGRTNRDIAGALFVSLRTVELHLSRSYAKLGISSRAGLAQALGS